MQYYFHFGGKEYEIKLYIVPGAVPLIFAHADLDRMGLNYQSLYKILERPEDGFVEPVEMRNGLPFLMFPSCGYLSACQLRTIHRNLGQPSVEKQMKVIEKADIQDLPKGIRKLVKEIVTHCRACQLQQEKPRRFLFSIKDPITGGFNHTLQIDVVKLSDDNVLHALDVGFPEWHIY